MYALGIDLGTNSVKALILELETGRIADIGQRGYGYIEGTEAHVFDGSIEYLIADHLRDKFGFPVHCYPHVLLKVGSKTHDLAHHGPSPGKRVWTRSSTALSWLKSMMISEVMAGREPTTVTYRGHFHEWVPLISHREVAMRTFPVEYESHFQFVPGYSGLSDYARKATQSQGYVTWGMVAVEVIDGKSISVHPIVNMYDTRVREEIAL